MHEAQLPVTKKKRNYNWFKNFLQIGLQVVPSADKLNPLEEICAFAIHLEDI